MRIPSSTTPALANMPMAVKLIQPDICPMRRLSSPESATAPGEPVPPAQSHSAVPTSATGRAPASTAMTTR